MSVAADLLKLADLVVGRPLCVLLPPFLRRAPAPAATPPRRVLVIRPGGIGDAVLFIPLLLELRRAWPEAALDVLVERRNAAVVEGTGLAGRVLRYDRPRDLWRALRGGWDLVIDTEQYHCLSAIVAALSFAPRRIGFGTNARRRVLTEARPYDQETYEARLFLDLGRAATGREPRWDPEAPFYPLAPRLLAEAEDLLRPLAGRPIVAIHPGASIPERQWPVGRYAEAARGLAQDGFAILLLGGPADRPRAATIAAALADAPHLDLSGRTPLPLVAALLARVAVYVSADTGPLHLAYAVGTPTVHLFGPGVLSKWGPPGRRFTTLLGHVPCSPCTVYGYTPPCAHGLACMRAITAGRVREAVRARFAADADARAAGERA